MSKSCSERSRHLVALCQNEPSPTLSERSIVSSCFTMSPLPTWWDSIFEASDVPVFNNHRSVVNVNLAKRKLLFSSPVKDSHDFHSSGSESHRLVQRELETHSGGAEIKVTNIDCESGLSNKCTNKADENLTLNEVFGSTDQSVVAGESVKPTPAKKTVGDSTNQSFDGCDSASEVQFMYPSLRHIRAVKLALNCGKEHVSRNGQLKKARSLKGPCKESCKRCCVPKLTPSERLEIHNLFWALRNHVKQWTFIFSCVTSTAPVRKSSASGAPGAKMSSRTYHFNVCGSKRKVCKTMFKNTLDICDSWIDSALSHFTNGQMSCDKRGRNKNVK